MTNNTHHHVAFKIKTTSPRKYCVRPNVGVLAPKSTCEFIVTMQAQMVAPEKMVCKDKFLIQSTLVPAETTREDVTSSLFVKDGMRYVEKNKLKVVLISPPNSKEIAPVNGDSNNRQFDHEKVQIYSKDEIQSPTPMVLISTISVTTSVGIMNKTPILEIEPKELKFIFELKKQSSCSIQLTNNTNHHVAFKDNWLLLTADYSQIELRLMAHFSKDSSLIELLSKPDGDVFTMIAARWIGCPVVSVNSQQREQTKKMVYGILYGMGPNSLAEQLDCTSDEAAERIGNFKSSFPGVASWLHKAVAFCRSKGYVETLKGRRRYLSKIKFGTSTEKSKAQRQAVNSICQGSAADIIKIAMIKMYSVIATGVDSPDSSSSVASQFHMLRDRCRILLQVHDELVLEVDPSMIKEAALLLQTSMENAVSLLVPLNVKLMVGRTWGSLEPFIPDKFKDAVLISESYSTEAIFCS